MEGQKSINFELIIQHMQLESIQLNTETCNVGKIYAWIKPHRHTLRLLAVFHFLKISRASTLVCILVSWGQLIANINAS